jgi:hypothetical protein
LDRPARTATSPPDAAARFGVRLAAIALLLVAWGSEARAETLRLAAVFGTAIAEPWVGRIHDALLRESDRSGISYRSSTRSARVRKG